VSDHAETSDARADSAEQRRVERLRARDEAAFMEIVEAWGPSMLRLARQFTPSTAVAEEVVQETWLAVLDGIDRFEGRSSLKTWVLRILVNRAKTRGTRERRTVPFASLAGEEAPKRRSTRVTGGARCRAGRRSPSVRSSRPRRSR